ncbi:MAG: GAF domain-containing protein [Enterobacterales bacterium]|nr:GAF domain-containing protein [Enterobacterales bacterium]
MSNYGTRIKLLEDAFFEKVINVCKTRVHFKLLTLMKYDAKNNRARRIYTTDNINYPIGNYKTLPDNQWTSQVIVQQKSFIANNISEIKKVFFDYQLISDMGLASVINVPIVSEGVLLGVVNLLHVKDSYNLVSCRKVERLSPWFTLLFKQVN